MRNKQRFVVDTNVVVSAMLFPRSKPRQAFDKAINSGKILISLSVRDELGEVITRAKFNRYTSEEKRQQFFDHLIEKAEMIEITETITACRDPKDDKYLELAVNGNAGFIISGDNDLLILSPFQGILILNPEEFLQLNVI
ncbi:putative toxin-antitoxin system toxin component, PIN family [Kamptonema sp. UHCC 0994]|uniref:putative toxin-antitoxin system toxin component, PIN family n=1 Tax=Kamptonema sp. UHCC 0994 TaxID=3031329 RepID=UPI0023B9EEF0|nr:putative toxin-antitoxin system toxin component, PIN family [Kamptonema sp. UHCC 0994]MDF0554155.1 putative toxin-antitoxin system toxin component, PIN family [Kamptonema sp. UHCC 0994]